MASKEELESLLEQIVLIIDDLGIDNLLASGRMRNNHG